MENARSYSVEFLHVYSDEEFNEEHIIGADTARNTLKSLPQDATTTVLLVDDYNPEHQTLDVTHFTKQAANHGVSIDQIAYEADLTMYVNDILGCVHSARLKNRYLQYISKRQKIPCSLLTAIWYLLRLGVITPRLQSTALTPATHLVNILPERFKPTEDKALAIIKQTPHRDILDNIENVYHASPKTHHPSL